MTPTEYLSKQDPERKKLMSSIHKLMLANKRLKPEVSKMMGQEMIQYKIEGMFMYALNGGKQHISLHLLPMYGAAAVHAKYQKLLSKAKFQKGCVNFSNEGQMPLDIVKDLLKDCAACEDKIIDQYNLRHKKKK